MSLGSEVLKAIYNKSNPYKTILYSLFKLFKFSDFSKIIIVGGYFFEDLKQYVIQYLPYKKKIELIYNPFFVEYGTAYSFECGIRALQAMDYDEIILMEGDLVLDRQTFQRIVNCKTNVITSNKSVITANQSVVFYISDRNEIRFLYDPQHRSISINTNFIVLGNSGQVWKFRDVKSLIECFSIINCKEAVTNLKIIEKYYDITDKFNYQIIPFNTWHNCNTVDDFRKSILK